MRTLRTGPFVDSRYEPACRLFERCSFGLPDLDRSNSTMEIDLDGWEPRAPVLPPGCRVYSFRPGDELAWCDLANRIFEGKWTEESFRRRFRDLPNFDPDGWFFAECDGRKVGIAGAIVWFADEVLTQPTGSLLEWVGLLPEARGRKLGEALVVSCLNYLKGREVYPNCLLTQYFREPAVRLYQKLGYRFVRECRAYVRALDPSQGQDG
jgi:mycothiol synthase